MTKNIILVPAVLDVMLPVKCVLSLEVMDVLNVLMVIINQLKQNVLLALLNAKPAPV